ncbi:MAG: lipoate--protein ligase family protein [Bifidobacterium psychraerophilum]|uniref:lipoate--protein ligase family protein n=1 Tax=Bifidobacterium psychraerophilum TaxID=218140 RepID=UPI0039ECEBF6
MSDGDMAIRRGRGECKMQGGKLVAASVQLHGSQVIRCVLDGDFFAEGNLDSPQVVDAVQGFLGECELPVSEADALAVVSRILGEYPASSLIGATPETIVTAFHRAVTAATSQGSVQDPKIIGDGGTETPRHEASQRHTDVVPHLPDGPQVSEELLTDFRGRWQKLPVTVVHDEPLMPSMQMACDHAIAQAVAQGDCGAMIRVWEWAASTVVIGRFQSIGHQVDVEEARREGVSVVRRVTGGGAMFVEPSNTITYSLYAPLSLVDGMTIEESYRCCDDWILAALQEIGIDARYEPINDISSSAGKIGGAAQRRYAPKQGGPGAVLHHVTMSYDIDAQKMTRILKVSREKMKYKAVQSAVKRVDPLRSQSGLGREAIIGSLIDHLLRTMRGARMGGIPAEIRQEAAKMDEGRFSTTQWTYGIA